MKSTKLFAAVAAFGIAVAATADSVPVAVGLFDPVQTQDAKDDIAGLEIGVLWDRSANVNGLAIAGGGNVTEGRMIGVSAALGFNWINEGGFGATWAIGFNRVGNDFGGAQFSYGANICHGDMYGLQDSISNYANAMHGVQLGIVNMSHNCRGLQVGIVNTAEEMSGVQVGILNFIKSSPLPFFPIVNAKF